RLAHMNSQPGRKRRVRISSLANLMVALALLMVQPWRTVVIVVCFLSSSAHALRVWAGYTCRSDSPPHQSRMPRRVLDATARVGRFRTEHNQLQPPAGWLLAVVPSGL